MFWNGILWLLDKLFLLIKILSFCFDDFLIESCALLCSDNCNVVFVELIINVYFINLRLREVAEKISRHGYTAPQALSSLRNLSVVQCVVGPQYVAFLLEVGTTVPLSLKSQN